MPDIRRRSRGGNPVCTQRLCPAKSFTQIPPIAACGPEKKGPNPPRSAAAEAPAGETQAGSEPTGSPSAIRPAAGHEAAAEGPISPPVPSAGSQGRDTAEGPRPARHRGEMAGGLGKGPRVRREGRSGPPEMVLDRPLSVHERIPASRVRDLVPAGGVPVAVPPDARLQRPPSASVPLHRPAILGAAKRVAEKEPKQWDILRKMGIPDRDIPKFADPMHWIEVFPEAAMEDLKGLGVAVDWTRSFITTPLNPPYDAFVRWQFHHLR